jgi:hypothetical protein
MYKQADEKWAEYIKNVEARVGQETMQAKAWIGQGLGSDYGSCPSCGYCRHCGRSGGYYQQPYRPYWNDIYSSGTLGYQGGGLNQTHTSCKG